MNFIQMCLSGEALEDEIDEFVERWHEGDEGLGLELHEYLGMTWDEYKLWGATPSALRFILAAHAENKTLDAVLQPEKYALAARAKDVRESEQITSWLRSVGKL